MKVDTSSFFDSVASDVKDGNDTASASGHYMQPPTVKNRRP